MTTSQDRSSGASGTAVQQVPGLSGGELREGYAEVGDVRLHYVEAWSQPGAATGMINYYRSSVRTSPKKAEAALRPISAPALVIWGQRDHYLGPELAEPDHDDVPNLDRVELLSDASHWVHHDEAERVNQLLIDFFGAALTAKNH